MSELPPSLPLLLRVLRDPRQAATFTLPEWDLLLRQSTATNLSPTLLDLLEQHGLLARIPAPARTLFEWVRPLADRHRQAVRYEVECIRDALAPTGLPLVLLKGAAYALAGLEAGRGRLFDDVDIMVPKARLSEVESALMLNGWAATRHDAYDQRYYREWMHELPPMQHMRRQSSIDVHHAILPETAPVRPDPASLLAAALPIDGIPGVSALAPADMVLHSAVHLFFDGEFDKGLRDLVDLQRLLREFGTQPGFWDALPDRARELQLARPLFYALRYSERLLGAAVPAHVMRDVAAAGAPNPAQLWLMDRLFLRALLPLHASCERRFSGTARFFLYVRGNWLRMPPLLLARHLFHKAFLSPRPEAMP